MGKKKLIIIFSSITIIILLVAYLGIGLYIANTLSTSQNLQFSNSLSDVNVNGEEFTVKTRDNIEISGWFFKSPKEKKCAIVLVPGFGQNRVDPSYGGIPIAQDLLKNGYGVAMFDPRGSGYSQTTRNTFGSKEGEDTLAVISYLSSKGIQPQNTGIIANSLGAITTLQFMKDYKKVGAIIVDSPAEAIQPFVERGLHDRKIPSFLFPGIFFMSKYFLGIDISSVRPIDKIKEDSNRKLLFLHGANDTLITPSNSLHLQQLSNPSSKRVVFQNAGHVQTYKTNPQLYKNTVYSFLKDELPDCN